jgi:hypothetical protein
MHAPGGLRPTVARSAVSSSSVSPRPPREAGWRRDVRVLGEPAAVGGTTQEPARPEDDGRSPPVGRGLRQTKEIASYCAIGVISEAIVPLTDAATITTDASLGNLFRVTLASNRTLGNPHTILHGGINQRLG